MGPRPADEKQSAAELDLVLQRHQNFQEKLSEEMLDLARSLKTNTLAAQSVIKKDNQVWGQGALLPLPWGLRGSCSGEGCCGWALLDQQQCGRKPKHWHSQQRAEHRHRWRGVACRYPLGGPVLLTSCPPRPQTLSHSLKMADQNLEKLKTESERLEQHAQKSVNWLLWAMLIVVCFIFISMILFIRIMPKLK